MKTLLSYGILLLTLGGCTSNNYKQPILETIILMEPGNHAIISNKIKEAHLICTELNNCGYDNDTVMSTYYDTLGRLVKKYLPANERLDQYFYSDRSYWKTKHILKEQEAHTYLFQYQVDEKAKVLTEYILENGDTLGTIQYKYNDEGKVFEYGPDIAGVLHFLEYNDDGLIAKEVIRHPDTTTYVNRFGHNAMDIAYKVEEQFFYNEGKLDSSVRHFYDIYDHKYRDPLFFNYRYDGLMESIEGEYKYIFSYVK